MPLELEPAGVDGEFVVAAAPDGLRIGPAASLPIDDDDGR
jgi:hypothetical protein